MKKGELYMIRFLDHVEDGKKPLPFEVFGRIMSVSKDHVTVASWDYANGKDREEMHNVKRFALVRSTIISAERLTVVNG